MSFVCLQIKIIDLQYNKLLKLAEVLDNIQPSVSQVEGCIALVCTK